MVPWILLETSYSSMFRGTGILPQRHPVFYNYDDDVKARRLWIV